jgi:hypothetical protein
LTHDGVMAWRTWRRHTAPLLFRCDAALRISNAVPDADWRHGGDAPSRLGAFAEPHAANAACRCLVP